MYVFWAILVINFDKIIFFYKKIKKNYKKNSNLQNLIKAEKNIFWGFNCIMKITAISDSFISPNKTNNLFAKKCKSNNNAAYIQNANNLIFKGQYSDKNFSEKSVSERLISPKKQAEYGFEYNKVFPRKIYFYPFPLSFGNRVYSTNREDLAETPENFQISKFDNISCPACGSIMMTKEIFYEFKDKIDKSEPDEYLSILSEYTKYMRPIELSVYNEITALSKKSGEKDVSQLVKMLRDTKLIQLQKIQLSRVREMLRLARTLSPSEKKVLNGKIKKLKKQITRKNSEAPFRRKIMIERISKIRLHNEEQQKKLKNIAISFPTSKDLNSAWIVKYSGYNKQGELWSSKDITLRMLSDSVPNTDHIIAYSSPQNHDDISNYMSMHKGCNVQKSNKSFLQWIYENKDLRLKSLQLYFNDVQKVINQGKISDKKYENYVACATKTIKEASNGKINLTI